jgi:polyhydroxybutyrate depolymerase
MKTFVVLLLTLTSLLSCKKDEPDPINGPVADKPSEQLTINLTIDGNARSFVLFLPTGYNNAGKMPLIFVLHGGSGTPSGMIDLADFRTIANRDKVVLVYPAGIQTSWNDGRPTNANTLGINDVSFFNQLCTYLTTNYAIDTTKIYATGISNGGFMSARLGCELSTKIAAFASVAASMEQNTVYANCNPSNAVPAIFIQGTLDGLVPFLGGTVVGPAGGTAVSHAQAIAKWISVNNCSTTPVVTNLPDIANDGTTITERKYTNAATGVEVVSYVVSGGGHTWPQGQQYLSENIIGKTSQDMNACETIWQFFKKYKR